MTSVLRFLFVIPFGFVTACLVASFAMLWPFVDFSSVPPGADPIAWFQVSVAFALQASQIGGTIFLPWAAFMVVTETFRLSSILLHLAAGILAAVILLFLAYDGDPPSASVQTAMLVAAITFSLVYWIIAGRRAGAWRARRREAARTDVPSA